MSTIFEHKELELTETPILLFECQLSNGQVERWSTHRVTAGGQTYAARVLRHNIFEIRTASDQGVDAIPRISLTLANADSHYSQIEQNVGWKGAALTARFVFYDLRADQPATEAVTLFKGTANPPDELTDEVFRLSAVNRMSLQRVLLPEVRVQRRCPWQFPSTSEEREEAAGGGVHVQYSRFYRCGYSPDISGGTGDLNGDVPYTSCNYTRADCEARGMFNEDSAQRHTARFGGIEFVPLSVLVRSFGEKTSQHAAVSANEGRYNDFVPLIYGTGWHSPMIVFARNDGNMTRLEVLLGMGPVEGVHQVLVNDIEIPAGEAGRNMTGTGWYNLVSTGHRSGGFNLDFTDASGSPLGDPYGSMAFLSVVVPNRLNDGRSLPRIRVLMSGVQVPLFDESGAYAGDSFTKNPCWILLDILRRTGWKENEIDLASFGRAAAYCSELIAATDLYGNPIWIPRFQCNLALTKRRTAADVIRGIRTGSRLSLTYGGEGTLMLRVENTLALQHAAKPPQSNSTAPLTGGWPAYEFGDGSDGTSGILRGSSGEPSIRLWSRATIDTPNRYAMEFQDQFNDYQQDSLSLVDVEDVNLSGQEITGPLGAMGVPNFSQAGRILKFHLDRSIRGNLYVEFETSVRGAGLAPGDIITLTYLKHGLQRQPFRIIRIAPNANFRTARIVAQTHSDAWYSDTNGVSARGGRRQPNAGLGLPRPLLGTLTDSAGEMQFEIEERAFGEGDGGASVEIAVRFGHPTVDVAADVDTPFVSLAAGIGSGGTLAGDQTLYYAVSAAGSDGREGSLSFVVPARIPPGGPEFSITLEDLRFGSGSAAFHVYRGENPWRLRRIASDQPISVLFTDIGYPAELVAPPDRNYHHANFYWRMEKQSEVAATIHSAGTIGNGSLQMPEDEYRGMTVRIMRGTGGGQERTIGFNTSTTFYLSRPWDTEPDATSMFTVCEAAWRAGASGAASPIQFVAPNRPGAVIQLIGRAANVNDEESPEELALVTRWTLGGAGGGALDWAAPPDPIFGLALPAGRGGMVEVAGLGFETLLNTRTITAATITLFYWDELTGAPATELATAALPQDDVLEIASAATLAEGTVFQADAEVLRITEAMGGGLYRVERGVHGTDSIAHSPGTAVYPLQRKVVIAPFARDFFGSPASGNWRFPIFLADARVASAEMFVANTVGNSGVTAVNFLQTVDYGLRTLSGGQYTMSVDGFLAIQDGATPDLVVDTPHSVRDLFAVVREAPVGSPVHLRLRQNGAEYCTLEIAPGLTISNSVPGRDLPPLEGGARIRLDITGVGQSAPGSDMTVVIRL